MEVIKHGNTYKEIECKNCNALLTYCKSDIRYEGSHSEGVGGLPHHSQEIRYVTCPECNNWIIISNIINGEEKIKLEHEVKLLSQRKNIQIINCAEPIINPITNEVVGYKYDKKE